MIILENRLKKNIFIEYEHATSSFRFIGVKPKEMGISGYFDFCEGNFLALYKYDSSLYFLCNNKRFPFDENLKISLLDETGPHWTTLEDEKKKRLIISLGDDEINILYPKLKINNELEDWIQPVSDVELFDFCYWVYNVWKEKRVRRLLEIWS